LYSGQGEFSRRLYCNGCCDLLIKHIKTKGRIPPSW
jgi:RNase P subunit RPR2